MAEFSAIENKINKKETEMWFMCNDTVILEGNLNFTHL